MRNCRISDGTYRCIGGCRLAASARSRQSGWGRGVAAEKGGALELVYSPHLYTLLWPVYFILAVWPYTNGYLSYWLNKCLPPPPDVFAKSDNRMFPDLYNTSKWYRENDRQGEKKGYKLGWAFSALECQFYCTNIFFNFRMFSFQHSLITFQQTKEVIFFNRRLLLLVPIIY